MEKQITNDELLMLTKKAFDRDEVSDFLQGKNGYACPVNRFVPANVPTDFGRILEWGIYIYYNETKDDAVIFKLSEAVLELLKGEPIQVWVAYNICWSQIFREQHNKSPFKLISTDLIEKTKTALIKNKEELTCCKKWEGWNKKSGLWSQISASNKNLKDDCGVGIL